MLDGSFINRIDIIRSKRMGIFTIGSALFDISQFDQQLFHFYGINHPSKLASAVKKRQAEYLAGRCVAVTSLQSYGITSTEIGSYPNRAPQWPNGYIGSISHTTGHAVAVVASIKHHTAAGIDIETVMESATFSRVLSAIAKDEEWRRVQASGGGLSAEQLGTLIFSAKESLFKALYPITHTFFDFTAATLTQLDVKARRFTLQLTCDWGSDYPAATEFTGRFCLYKNTIVTLLIT